MGLLGTLTHRERVSVCTTFHIFAKNAADSL